MGSRCRLLDAFDALFKPTEPRHSGLPQHNSRRENRGKKQK
jgi:hypothetical protein